MGATWGRQDPGGSHVGPMKIVISAISSILLIWQFLNITKTLIAILCLSINMLTPSPQYQWAQFESNVLHAAWLGNYFYISSLTVLDITSQCGAIPPGANQLLN